MLPSISIIVLNWNGTDDTLNCLEWLSRIKCPELSVQIIVIDNGSDADPTPEIQAAFPETKTTRLPRNIGFAAGCNMGAKKAIENGAEYVLFLNNDTEVEPGFLLPLIATVQNNRQIGIACSVIKAIDGTTEFAGSKIDFALGSFKARHGWQSGASPIATDYANGCSMLVPVRTLRAIGTFDENLFSYFEDTDLSLRSQRAGLETVVVPESIVRHRGSASTRRGLTEGTTSPMKHYLVARNRTVIVRRHATALPKCLYLLVTVPVRACFYTAAFIARARWSKLRWFWRGTLDGVIGKMEMPAELMR